MNPGLELSCKFAPKDQIIEKHKNIKLINTLIIKRYSKYIMQKYINEPLI
jgi:hypothetical protein